MLRASPAAQDQRNSDRPARWPHNGRWIRSRQNARLRVTGRGCRPENCHCRKARAPDRLNSFGSNDADYVRRVYRTLVGEANVVEIMQAVKAVIGGEGSNAGIIVPAVPLCRDRYTAIAFLLERLPAGANGRNRRDQISALAARLPRFYRKAGEVAYEPGPPRPADTGARRELPRRQDRTAPTASI